MVDAYNAVTYSPGGQSVSPSAVVNPSNLSGVENAILATDATYQAFGGTPTSYVNGLYQSILGRTPDPTGLSYYAGLISSGDSRQDVIDQLQSTDEAKRTEVARWYQQELGWNEPVADLKVNTGVDYWASLIDAGVNVDEVHAQVLAYGLAPSGDPTAYVTALYQAALGRTPDPTGLSYYAGQINQGVSRLDIARNLLGSYEARRTEVARIYQNELGSLVSVASLKVDAGVEYWAGLIGGWS